MVYSSFECWSSRVRLNQWHDLICNNTNTQDTGKMSHILSFSRSLAFNARSAGTAGWSIVRATAETKVSRVIHMSSVLLEDKVQNQEEKKVPDDIHVSGNWYNKRTPVGCQSLRDWWHGRFLTSHSNPSLWLAVVPVMLHDRPTPPPSVGGEDLSKPSPEPLLHVTASGINPTVTSPQSAGQFVTPELTTLHVPT